MSKVQPGADGTDFSQSIEKERQGQTQSFDGTVIDGRYKLHEKIGAGNMAVVYRAEHVATARVVAIKILTGTSDGSAHVRFQREAKAVLAIRHPNIVAAYDYGILENGESFLVMDYIQGSSLEKLIDAREYFSREEVVDLMVQVASGLAEAHSLGILHRDIKPSNIMLVELRGILVPRIVDFGLAKTIEDASSPRLTKNIIGTPLYISPEQCAGVDVDARSDLYSLGCVMYEMVTGRPPFLTDTSMKLLHMHLHDKPKNFNEIADKNIDRSLERIILKLLEKDPAKRFQSASELVQALKSARNRDPVRSKILIAGATIAVFAMVGLGTYFFAHYASSSKPSAKSATNPASATAPETGIVSPGANPEEQQRLWAGEDAQGQRELDVGNADPAQQHFLKALDIATRYQGTDQSVIHEIAFDELCDLSMCTHHRQAHQQYESEAMNIHRLLFQQYVNRLKPLVAELKKIIAKKKADFTKEERSHANDVIAEAHAESVAYGDAGFYNLQQELSRIIEDACRSVGNELELARLDVNIGTLLMRQNRRDQAELLLKEGLALYKKLLPPYHPDLGRAYSFLGRAQLRWRDKECPKNLEMAYKIYCGAHGKASLQAGSVASKLASWYEIQKDKAQMEHYANIAVNVLNAVPVPENPSIDKWGDLAGAYLVLGSKDLAASAMQKAVDRDELLLSGRFNRLEPDLEDLAFMLNSQGQSEQAHVLKHRLSAIRSRLQDFEDTLLPETLAIFK